MDNEHLHLRAVQVFVSYKLTVRRAGYFCGAFTL